MSKRRGLWDSVVARNATLIASDDDMKIALADFRRELVQLGFEQHASGRVEADVPTIVGQQTNVIAAIRTVASRVTVGAASE